MSFVVPGGYDESHLCVSYEEAFAERHPPGQCAHKIVAKKGSSLTTGEYAFQVPTGTTVFLQLHIVVGNETAYAAWTPGGPFHGNIEVPPVPTPVTPDPVACPADMVPEGGTVEVDPETGEPTNCVTPEPVTCPADMVPEGGTVDVDPETGEPTNCVAEEEEEVVVAITCPDGSTPMVDRNRDGVIDARDCVATSVLPEVVVPNLPVNNPVLPPLTPTFPRTPAQPAAPVQPVVAAPLAPVPAVDVLPAAEVVPTVVTVDNPQVTEVLGDQVVAGSLPRTGASTSGLAAFGTLLLAAGLVLTRTGRRTA